MSERGGDGKARGLGVVDHVVVGRVGEHDLRARLTDHHGEALDQVDGVDDLQIVTKGSVPRCPKDVSSLLGLKTAHLGSRFGVHRERAATAVGEAEVVQRVANASELQQSAGEKKLDVVRVGDNGDGRFHTFLATETEVSTRVFLRGVPLQQSDRRRTKLRRFYTIPRAR